MITNNFKQTVLRTIEDYESAESFMFLRGYKRESRLVGEGAQMLAEGLVEWANANEAERMTIEYRLFEIMMAVNDFRTSILQIEVNKYL